MSERYNYKLQINPFQLAHKNSTQCHDQCSRPNEQKIANNYANGFALDLGTLFKTPYGFRLGTSISNFGPKMKMTGDDLLVPVDIDETIYGNNESVTGYLSTDEFDLPLVLRVGISNDVFIGGNNRITWAVDSNSPNDNRSYINMGVEVGLMNDICLLYTYPSPRDRTRSRMPSSA